ncbi:AraC family transcriptional regulator [Novosphingobium piscinae]|uniref:AraC family transcriptional regulator n=1 Tax=Novosphingobium piscinae TaxID=1507448 RepID=A0A7X1FZ76_9SPHN|nr:AraC family transcriptional regulator [Novosphingobium piscinae]MBC2669564.1 AraC family transcriptional regulator [Novosphingobium piscinae]
MGEAMISAQFLRHVANCMELTGHPAAGLLDGIGVGRELLDDPDGMIPLASFLAFFEQAANLVRNPHFGLHAGRLAGSDSLGPLSFLFLSAPTLRQAFLSFTRYLSAMQQASTNQFVDGPGGATFSYGVLDQSLPHRRQDAEYSLGAMFSLARQFTGGEIELREVRFEHERVGDYARYREYFGCDVFFEQDCNAFSIDAHYLDLPGRVLSSSLHPILEDHLRRKAGDPGGLTYADRVTAYIAARPLDDPPSIADAAAHLGLSVPTLGRRLRAAGTTWRELLHEHRMVAAARLLRDSRRSISAIALAVGFSESASFIRSFSRHFGQSPHRFRITPPR